MIPDPVIRLLWEGRWEAGAVELPRLLYDCELVHVSEGAFDLEVAGRTQRLCQGQVVVIPPATVHRSTVPVGMAVKRHCIHFDWTPADTGREAPLFAHDRAGFQSELVHAVPAELAPRLPLVADLAAHRPVLEMLQNALRLLRSQDPLGPWQLGVVLRWFIDPRPARPPDGRRSRSLARVLAAVEHIDRQYADPVGHAELCRIAGLASSQLCAGFQAAVGRAPLAYLLEVRMRTAQHLLAVSDLPVAAVAQQVGIPDANYFSRLFHRFAGRSPLEFRALSRAAAARSAAGLAPMPTARSVPAGWRGRAAPAGSRRPSPADARGGRPPRRR